MRIDLNADVGEGFGFDSELISVVSSANICCGSHAGNTELSKKTAQLCQEKNVTFGAHPGFPDKASMGRASLKIASREASRQLVESIRYQIEFLVELGASYVKPHGALYNQSAQEEEIAQILRDSLLDSGLPLLGLAGTYHESIAEELGIVFVNEGFADRAYDSDGFLRPRGEKGSVLDSPIEVCRQAVSIAKNVGSICIHGDTEGCVDLAVAVRTVLEAKGFEVRAWA